MNQYSDITINKIEELKTQKNSDSLKELLEFIDDNDLSVKLTAIEALTFFCAFIEAKNMLLKLLLDANGEVRYYAIKSLISFSGDDVFNALTVKLNDPDALIRIIAVEVLGDINLQQAIPSLRRLLSDKNELVRCIVAETLGTSRNKDLIPILEEGLKHEKRNTARLGFYIGLYRLGERRYLDFILNMLKVRSYRVRCATANSLVELADKDNYIRIIEALKKALSIEKTIAARSSILNSLNELSNFERN